MHCDNFKYTNMLENKHLGKRRNNLFVSRESIREGKISRIKKQKRNKEEALSSSHHHPHLTLLET